jgi:hypothetical protein
MTDAPETAPTYRRALGLPQDTRVCVAYERSSWNTSNNLPATSPLNSPLHLTYVRIRQHTSAYVSIRQHTSAYVSIRQHTSAYVSILEGSAPLHLTYIRQHTSAYVSIRLGSAPLHLAYVSIRQHTSAYVSIRKGSAPLHLTYVSTQLGIVVEIEYRFWNSSSLRHSCEERSQIVILYVPEFCSFCNSRCSFLILERKSARIGLLLALFAYSCGGETYICITTISYSGRYTWFQAHHMRRGDPTAGDQSINYLLNKWIKLTLC